MAHLTFEEFSTYANLIVWWLSCESSRGRLRDHVLRLLVQHLSICHHHAASHLLVQVSEDVVNRLPHMKIILRHPWRK